jgi:hypothetical protein
MEFGVLKYPEVGGLPVIDEIVKLWGTEYRPGKVFSCCGSNWIKVKGPRVGKTHPRLAWLWRELVGLYGVYCEPKNWGVFDPINKRIALADYVTTAFDWTTVRIDGDAPVIPETKQQYIDEKVGLDIGSLTPEDILLVCARLRTEALDDLGLIIPSKATLEETLDAMWAKELELDRRKPFENKAVKVVTYPAATVDPNHPLIIGRIKATKIWPSVGSNIGSGGNRIDEASTKPVDVIRVR